MRNICVFISANSGNDIDYLNKAISLGQEIARHDLTLIYGGSNVGLMGALADAVLHEDGKAIGVTPDKTILPNEIAHQKLTTLHIVESMQERKSLMTTLADGFIILPGGLGTLEELFEVWNAVKLGLHNKPIGLLNVNGYFDHLLSFLKHSVDQGLLNQEHLNLIIMEEEPAVLLQKLMRAI